MAAITEITIGDSFDIWRQRTNEAITRLNNLTVANDVFELRPPINQTDILVYDATAQKFYNTTIYSLVNEVLTQLANNPTQMARTFFDANSRSYVY